MGIYIRQIATNFIIPKEHCAAALAAIKALASRAPIHDQSGDHFSFVPTAKFVEAITLEEALTAWRWVPETLEDGTIDAIEFEGEKHGDEDILFAAIAPYVKAGSYVGIVIEGDGEDEFWRWLFNGQHVYKVRGQLIFEKPAEANQLDLDQLPGWVVFPR